MSRSLLYCWVLALGFLTPISGADYAEVKARAEKYFEEGSFERALDEYATLNLAELSPEQKRWVQLRLADAALRSQLASNQPDDSELRQAQTALQQLVGEQQPRDRVWAEAQEALGDFHWQKHWHPNWSGGWAHYEQALDYWAGTTNLTLASERYLRIVRKAAEPPRPQPYYYYGYFGNYLPIWVLENALKIAKSEEDQAHFHYLMAMTLRSQGGSWEQRYRIPHEFEQAVKLKKDTRWYDDALYFYADWMNSNGRAVRNAEGNWSFEPDYTKALELFRRLTTEYREGESQWRDDAVQRVQEITTPTLSAQVDQVFLPGSDIFFHVRWRNMDRINFTLFQIDLTKNVAMSDPQKSVSEWLQHIQTRDAGKVKSWDREAKAGRPHEPGAERIELDTKLAPGAYLLLSSSGNTQVRELILVSDLAIVAQAAGKNMLVYVCDSASGAPVADAQLSTWERYYDNANWNVNHSAKKADKQGLALFEANRRGIHREYLVTARKGERQAFAMVHSHYGGNDFERWKIYAVTDRPAYRPTEVVHWKITARQQTGFGKYSVPSARKVTIQITDPHGAEIQKKDAELNSFGSAWGELTLTTDMPLGEYRATFLKPGASEVIGAATLFRLEEYKLPEFKVAVQTPRENGKAKTFLLGEKVEVEISADYYFGGPVANATVEAVVRQSAVYHSFEPPREFDWYHEEQFSSRIRRPGSGQEIQRETLTTDAEGKVRFSIQSPFGHNTDLEYEIEARVVDASRREITGKGVVRVSKQRFYIYPKAGHNLYRPQDNVEVAFTAQDVNNQPVQAEGIVRVTRDFWFEIWVNPQGKEVKGEELKKLRANGPFPPPAKAGESAWRLKFRGYQSDEILTQTLKTDTNGMARLSFTPEREGYYRVRWTSDEELQEGVIPSRPIRGETTVWVSTSTSTDIGYRPGGLEILADKESFRPGEKAPVLLSVPSNDRYVLFTVSAGDHFEYRLVHMTGQVKLIELEIGEQHTPNIFLHGAMTMDHQVFANQREIVVPPLQNFLDVELSSSRPEFKPGEEGEFTIVARDHSGQPVSAELSLGVVDESVFYIQQDYAGDPRKFFFGSKRPQLLQTYTSFSQKPYRKTSLAREDGEEDELGRRGGRGTDYYAFDALGETAAPEAQAVYLGREFRRERAVLRDLAPAAAEPVMAFSEARGAKTEALGLAAAIPPEEAAAVQVRSDFRSTLLWVPDLKTGSDGRATLKMKYADSLTGWKATARAVTEGNQFGIAETVTRTRQPLIVRLQSPRFFLVGDTVTVSAVVNNNTDQEAGAEVKMNISGAEMHQPQSQSVKVPPQGEARVDWTFRPQKAGEVKLSVTARGGEHSDAMERSFLVHEHGIEKFIAVAGKSTGTEALASLLLPAARKGETTRFSVQVTPSLAVTMLDALPYLIDYPYGCTEQTMSRFLPAAITSKTLKDLGLNPEDVLSRVFGGIEQAHVAKTQPQGRKHLDKLSELTKAGLKRLYDFQHSDGGWGWWKDGETDLFMSGYVLWGFSIAHEAGIEIEESPLYGLASFLDRKLVEAEQQPDLQAWMLHALAAHHKAIGVDRPSEFQEKAFENLWQRRERLNAYTRALFALAAHYLKKADEAQTLIRNLENGVQRDTNPGGSVLQPTGANNQNAHAMATAHWGNDGIYYRWSEGGVEATAFALRALLAIDPKNALVEPVANWLIKNRRGAQWSNTRDTAIVVLALNDFLRVSGELKAELEYELLVNGQSIARKKISGTDLFSGPSVFEIPGEHLRDGKNEVRIVRKGGEAPIYFAAQCSFFSLEEPIAPAGNEIFIKREQFRIVPVPTLLKGYEFRKELLEPEAKVSSNDRIETVITIEAKNNYEYLVFEDLKPAGLEAVEIRSGEPLYANQIRKSSVNPAALKPVVVEETIPDDQRQTGHSRWVYQELRDRKVLLFIDKLPQGIWEIRYEMRAETPGDFHALPVVGHAMYVPEIKGNSAESQVRVEERKRE